MPIPRFMTPTKTSATARSVLASYDDILIHSAWQDDTLIWLGLGWVKDGAETVQAKAAKALPHFHFSVTPDSGETAHILTAWRGNRLTDLPMTLYGTAFQQLVWQELLCLHPLERPTYGQIAARIGRPKACRAVGSAVGANPITLLVPCHRILPQAGGVGNYGWGAPMKAHLLTLEETMYAQDKAA